MDPTEQPADSGGGSPPEKPDHRSLYGKAWTPLRGVLLVTEIVARAHQHEGPALAAQALVIIGDCAVALARVKNRTVG